MKKSKSFVSVGHNNFIAVEKIVSINVYKSKPVKDIVNIAKKNNMVMDCTMGKKTRSTILTSDGFHILSCVESISIMERIVEQNNDSGGVDGKVPKVRIQNSKSVSAKGKDKSIDRNRKK